MAQGETGGEEIATLEKGNKERTARHADVMNEIIDALNALMQMTVSPQSAGKLIWSDANAVLQINNPGSSGCGDSEPPESGTFVCGSVDGVKQWIETEECGCGVDGGSA